jgi:RHS repeat-associated protein
MKMLTSLGSAVGITGTSNKKLYSGRSEWQNDYSNLPDYYQTFYRNYDAVLGRFVGVDPMPESSADLTTYNYAGNNPIVFNDPLGDYSLSPSQFAVIVSNLYKNSTGYGGTYNVSDESYHTFNDDDEMGMLNGIWGAAAAISNLSGGGASGGGASGSAPVTAAEITKNGLLNSGNNIGLSYSNGGMTLWSSNNYLVDNPDYDSNDRYSMKYMPVISSTATYVSFANQGGPGSYPGFRQFAALVIGESSADYPNKAESAGIASVIINRLNAVKESLNDPNWIKKVGTASAYDGVNTARYKISMGLTLDQIAAKYPTQYAGILQAFNNWGTDYGGNANPSYYWTAAGLTSGYAYQQYMAGNMIRNTIGGSTGTTFYAFKVGTWQWTP